MPANYIFYVFGNLGIQWNVYTYFDTVRGIAWDKSFQEEGTAMKTSSEICRSEVTELSCESYSISRLLITWTKTFYFWLSETFLRRVLELQGTIDLNTVNF